ncbi:MAG: hypothetical protein GW748_02360 [Alphaproteobacteria bacterium]|nr:hypothetical protein [Alphaproteobacteria bacterium]NCQ66571.1 hypothetical protein [Alphaproteobacteria bacterium]NCT06923.1 hypothetical protein [Alphaproteobacteria bacterium]
MKKILITVMLLMCPLSANASSSENVLEVEDVLVKIPSVDEVFPMRDVPYSLEEFLKGFKSLVHNDLWDDFKVGWSAIYDGYEEALDSDKPARRLSVEKETEHIHCFYNSLRGSNPLDEDYLEMQKITIYSRFLAPTHRRLIAAKNSDLADRVTDFMQ